MDSVQSEKMPMQNMGGNSGMPQKVTNTKHFWYGIGLFIGVVVVVGLGVGLYQVYGRASVAPTTVTFAKVLRLPIAKVDGSSILFTEYATDLTAIVKVAEYDKATNGPTANLTSAQQSDQVLWAPKFLLLLQ
jgi:hypothetical protein